MKNALQTKEVNFNGDQIICVQNEQDIYVAVKHICMCLGLPEGQAKRQVENISKDIVLSKGVANLRLLTNGGQQEALCIVLNFLPLWLAKISITPAMKKTNPVLVEKLINYQIKAKDVLAAAFLPKEVQHIQNNSYDVLLKNLNENQKILIYEQRKLGDKLSEHIQSYGKDKEDFCNTTLSIGYELENIKKDIEQEIKDRTSYIPVRPLVSKRLNAINKARFSVIEKYTQNLDNKTLEQNFTNRINNIVSDMINEKWTISKMRDFANDKSSFYSGDSAFLHDICETICKYYDGLKIS